jgi:hypothetical protein
MDEKIERKVKRKKEKVSRKSKVFENMERKTEREEINLGRGESERKRKKWQIKTTKMIRYVGENGRGR